jgi:4-amino-4-deoxy-L-arabinose transferase-like glycosyltransferase
MLETKPDVSRHDLPFGASRWLLPIMLVAATLRGSWLAFCTRAINGEGAEYARIAENLATGQGYVGIAMEGRELMFPPLYPLTIAAGSYFVGSSYLSAQLVSLSAGILLLLAVFGIARQLYGERVALITVALTALNPVLIKLSATAWVEGLYIALVMSGLYFMVRARHSVGSLPWALAGIFMGLAYLTSPQAVLFPFIFLVSQIFLPQGQYPINVRKSAVLLASFVLLALPYVAFLSTSTGSLRIEGKTIVNNELGRLRTSGVSDCLAGYEVTENLEAKGIWMRPNAEIAASAGPANYGTTLKMMYSGGLQNLRTVAGAYRKFFYLGAPLIPILVLVGLFRGTRSADRVAGELLLALTALGGVAALMTQVHMFQQRYHFFLIPYLLVWAANGIAELSRWSRDWLETRGASSICQRIAGRLTGAVILAVIVALFATGFDAIPTFDADSGARADAIREAGDWLASAPGDKIVMDNATPVAFHANAHYVPLPCCNSDTALRFAEKKNVTFIVLTSWTLADRPYTQDWWSHGVSSRKAALVRSIGSPSDRQIRIYRLHHDGVQPERN